jgi:hypothetical protein
MLTDTICSGALEREDGLFMARGVTLSMMTGQEPPVLGDIKSTLTVYDDPAFARRYVGKRFVFVSAHDPDYRVEVFIVGADGACIAFPMPKPGAP